MEFVWEILMEYLCSVTISCAFEIVLPKLKAQTLNARKCFYEKQSYSQVVVPFGSTKPQTIDQPSNHIFTI